jgi:hypothetical protein
LLQYLAQLSTPERYRCALVRDRNPEQDIGKKGIYPICLVISFCRLNQLNPTKFAQLPQFAFDNFRPGLLSFLARQRIATSCPRAWERVLVHQIRVSRAANGGAENNIVSVLSPALTALPPG